MTNVRVLVDVVVVASVVPALAIAPRVLARRSGTAGTAGRSLRSPEPNGVNGVPAPPSA